MDARRLLLVLLVALPSCASWRVVDHPSPNYDGRVRFLVMHFTDEDFARSLHVLTDPDSKSRVSAHYLVSAPGDPARAPRVYRLVPERFRAWHAGDSRWQGRQAINDQSIGIEIVYAPSCPGPHALPPGATPAPPVLDPCEYPEYPRAQIERVVRLARGVLARYPDIDATRVVGHADVAPHRKPDPGPRFPWRELAAAGVGAWYDDAAVARWRAWIDREQPALRVQTVGATRYFDAAGLVDRTLGLDARDGEVCGDR
jgi:N-acetylmuramoyl-L-alanine amidase